MQRGRFAQVRLELPAPAAPDGQLTLHYLDTDSGPPAPTDRSAAAGGAVVTRAGWGADERLRFDGDPPPELAAPALQASEAGALLRRSGAGYNPRIMKTTGSRSSG